MLKIPSSLKWLIDQRGRVEGEILKIERSLARCERTLAQCQALADELKPLRKLLESVDQTLTLHEIKIDPLFIQPILSKDRERIVPHGEMSRAILTCLRMAQEKPIPSSEIVDFVMEYFARCGYPPISRGVLCRRIRVRLRGMLYEGRVKRHHDPDSKGYGIWSLADRLTSPSIRTLGGGPGSTP
jgi:hypothetical protein